ncbi:MAG TPA: 8-amino-7-oxononanoate synthase [Pirellulales bacterium]|jgi:8-amino-7-oxononanoate synthase|nr:8-amino-7-oxononanoate synthase [Pirellulales bacterium]
MTERAGPLGWISQALAELERDDHRRHLQTRAGLQGAIIELDGARLSNFGSNDYLGLAGDGRLRQAAARALENEGVGAGASPLVNGHSSWHARLERRLAEFEGAEAALVFNSGFAANLGTVAALVGREDAVFADQLNHASLIDGCRLSRSDIHIYPHRDTAQLEALLGSHRQYRRRLILSDSVFSMDGDLAPLKTLAELAARHDAMLLVDEAHATGVFGPGGRGLAAAEGIEAGAIVRVGTLSKALGAAGGFVCGSRELVDWLANRSRSYVFSTALPPAIAAAAIAALDIIEQEPTAGARLLERSAQLRARLAAQGWNIGDSASQIIPVIVGDAGRTLALSRRLRERGCYVPAIRPPSVPAGQSRLRISLTAAHTDAMLDELACELEAEK